MFPGMPFPGANGLTATVPDLLAVGTAVAYMCPDPNREPNPIQSNMCNMNGMFATLVAPTCDLGE